MIRKQSHKFLSTRFEHLKLWWTTVALVFDFVVFVGRVSAQSLACLPVASYNVPHSCSCCSRFQHFQVLQLRQKHSRKKLLAWLEKGALKKISDFSFRAPLEFQRLVQKVANCNCLYPPTRACYACGRVGTVYKFVCLSLKVPMHF